MESRILPRRSAAPISGVTLVASTEPWETIEALTPEAAAEAEDGTAPRPARASRRRPMTGALVPELVLAADQFIITPAGRAEEAARARGRGRRSAHRDRRLSLVHRLGPRHDDQPRRADAVARGRYREAGYILRTFAHYVRDGLIPNMFPDGEREGLYHTADATLWFFHAVERYVARHRRPRDAASACCRRSSTSSAATSRGTRFGIGVDPADGLLRQGAEGYQLTWMDAKVDDWVVTPRRGKAVEINALWYNALRLLEGWTQESGGERTASI